MITPAGSDASQNPTATPPPPSSCTPGAASDSGATENAGTSQPSSSTLRSTRRSSTARMPPSESPSSERRMPGTARAGRELVPPRTRAADSTNVAASIASAPRGDASTSSSPPVALPTTWADCETMRKSDRPATNVSPGRIDASSAVRVPAWIGLSRPSAASRASSAQTGA